MLVHSIARMIKDLCVSFKDQKRGVGNRLQVIEEARRKREDIQSNENKNIFNRSRALLLASSRSFIEMHFLSIQKLWIPSKCNEVK